MKNEFAGLLAVIGAVSIIIGVVSGFGAYNNAEMLVNAGLMDISNAIKVVIGLAVGFSGVIPGITLIAVGKVIDMQDELKREIRRD